MPYPDTIKETKRNALYIIRAEFAHNTAAATYYLRFSGTADRVKIDPIQWVETQSAAHGLDIETASKWLRFLMLNTSAHTVSMAQHIPDTEPTHAPGCPSHDGGICKCADYPEVSPNV